MQPTPDDLIHSPTAGRGWAVSGLILMGISILGILRVLREIESVLPDGGYEETHVLNEKISHLREAGVNLIAWTGPGLIGLVLVSVALMSKRNREKWFLIWGLIMALLWLVFFFPFGLYLTVIFLMRWKGFLGRPRAL